MGWLLLPPGGFAHELPFLKAACVNTHIDICTCSHIYTYALEYIRRYISALWESPVASLFGRLCCLGSPVRWSRLMDRVRVASSLSHQIGVASLESPTRSCPFQDGSDSYPSSKQCRLCYSSEESSGPRLARLLRPRPALRPRLAQLSGLASPK